MYKLHRMEEFNLPIVIGRSPEDTKTYGTKGAILLGRKYTQQAENLILAGDIFLDVSDAHVMFICGKRGGGKSYTMGVVAEGVSMLEDEDRNKLSIVMLDTMGVYWTMTHPNQEEKKLLEPYKLKPH